MYLDFKKLFLLSREKEILLQMESEFEFINDKIFNDENIFVVKLVSKI